MQDAKKCPTVYTIDVDTSPLSDKGQSESYSTLGLLFQYIRWILMLDSSAVKLFWFRFPQRSICKWRTEPANQQQHQKGMESCLQRSLFLSGLHDLSESPSFQKRFLTERLWSIVFETLNALSSEFLSTMIVMRMHYAVLWFIISCWTCVTVLVFRIHCLIFKNCITIKLS